MVALDLRLRAGLVRASLVTSYGGHYWADRVERLTRDALLPLAAILLRERAAATPETALLSLLRLRRLDDILLDGTLIGDLQLRPAAWAAVKPHHGPLEGHLRQFPGWVRPTAPNAGYPAWDATLAVQDMALMAALVRSALRIEHEGDSLFGGSDDAARTVSDDRKWWPG